MHALKARVSITNADAKLGGNGADRRTGGKERRRDQNRGASRRPSFTPRRRPRSRPGFARSKIYARSCSANLPKIATNRNRTARIVSSQASRALTTSTQRRSSSRRNGTAPTMLRCRSSEDAERPAHGGVRQNRTALRWRQARRARGDDRARGAITRTRRRKRPIAHADAPAAYARAAGTQRVIKDRSASRR